MVVVLRQMGGFGYTMLIQVNDIEPSGSDQLPLPLQEKYKALQMLLQQMGRVLVAFSGGVDSTLVAKVALDTLGAANVFAVIAVSASLSQSEEQDAYALLKEISIPYEVVHTHEVDDPRYAANPANRCYFCKEHVYDSLAEISNNHGYSIVVDGFNTDDSGDHRPGRQAGRERGVRSPLHEAGMNKSDIRMLARYLGLRNWAKPAMACLSSRVEYNTVITPQMLRQIDQAEMALRALGFKNLRVRHHGTVARIEVEDTMLSEVLAQREAIINAVKAVGYVYVTLDLQGLRQGSMNEALLPRG